MVCMLTLIYKYFLIWVFLYFTSIPINYAHALDSEQDYQNLIKTYIALAAQNDRTKLGSINLYIPFRHGRSESYFCVLEDLKDLNIARQYIADGQGANFTKKMRDAIQKSRNLKFFNYRTQNDIYDRWYSDWHKGGICHTIIAYPRELVAFINRASSGRGSSFQGRKFAHSFNKLASVEGLYEEFAVGRGYKNYSQYILSRELGSAFEKETPNPTQNELDLLVEFGIGSSDEYATLIMDAEKNDYTLTNHREAVKYLEVKQEAEKQLAEFGIRSSDEYATLKMNAEKNGYTLNNYREAIKYLEVKEEAEKQGVENFAQYILIRDISDIFGTKLPKPTPIELSQLAEFGIETIVEWNDLKQDMVNKRYNRDNTVQEAIQYLKDKQQAAQESRYLSPLTIRNRREEFFKLQAEYGSLGEQNLTEKLGSINLFTPTKNDNFNICALKDVERLAVNGYLNINRGKNFNHRMHTAILQTQKKFWSKNQTFHKYDAVVDIVDEYKRGFYCHTVIAYPRQVVDLIQALSAINTNLGYDYNKIKPVNELYKWAAADLGFESFDEWKLSEKIGVNSKEFDQFRAAGVKNIADWDSLIEEIKEAGYSAEVGLDIVVQYIDDKVTAAAQGVTPLAVLQEREAARQAAAKQRADKIKRGEGYFVYYEDSPCRSDADRTCVLKSEFNQMCKQVGDNYIFNEFGYPFPDVFETSFVLSYPKLLKFYRNNRDSVSGPLTFVSSGSCYFSFKISGTLDGTSFSNTIFCPVHGIEGDGDNFYMKGKAHCFKR